jgi:subtilisin-like proprotein convertase family protein
LRNRLLAVALVFVLSLPPVVGTEPAVARKRTVTRTFRSATAIAIPGADADGRGDPYPSTITVSGFKKPRILDVNVTLRSLNHTLPHDIDALLVAPDGHNAMIMSDTGGSGDALSDITLKLDDEAKKSMDDGTIVSGSYQPFDRVPGDIMPGTAPVPSGAMALSVFDGIDPNGTWQLYIADDNSEPLEGTNDPGFGELSGGWELQIKARR